MKANPTDNVTFTALPIVKFIWLNIQHSLS